MNNETVRVLRAAIAVNAAENLDEIVHTVIERVDRLFRYDRASIALLDSTESTLELRQISLRGSAKSVEDIGKQIPVTNDTALGWAVLHNKPHVRGSVDESSRFNRVQAGSEPVSHVIAPITGRNAVLGVLCIGSFRENAFNDEDVAVIADYARLVGVAIENLKNYQRSQELSIRDGLTGCYNHRHFIGELKREIDRLSRYGGSLSLVMLDIDYFKSFNDEFGHQAGDRILVQTVEIINRFTRSSDILFRYGGEEFCLLLPSTDIDGTVRAADKLLDKLRENNFYRPDRTRTVPIRLSMGIASAPKHADSPEGLIACADQALYRAKNTGRDQAVAFEETERILQAVSALKAGQTKADGRLKFDRALPLNEHSVRVAEFAEMAARTVHLSDEQRVNLQIAAYFHDLGESTISDEVIQKPGKLDHHERKLIETHPVVGEGILRRSIKVKDILDAVLYHHERYDGNGYPQGLKGKEIPLLARILAIAEVFDALVTERPYRAPLSLDEAYATLRKVAGYQLDPELVEKFIESHQQNSKAVNS